MDFLTGGVLFSILSWLLYQGFTGQVRFAPNSCPHLEPYLKEHIVGQDLALQQLVHAICDHLEDYEQELLRPNKPLVVSVHGPPGVGKSLTHYLLARALYNKQPESATDCPGTHCQGYKVLYGMDYVMQEREQQHRLLREALIGHLQFVPESLVVVEEYDKLDCDSRALFRQLLDSPQTANVTWGKSIVLLESNSGYTQLLDMLEVAKGQRDKIAAEDATRVLKDLVFGKWVELGCESHIDSQKLLGLIDFYLPFFPLERSHIEDLIARQLAKRQARQVKAGKPGITWDDKLPQFLASKVDFDGKYPVEGAKEVKTIMTRYVSSALRKWELAHDAAEADSKLHSLHLNLPLQRQHELSVNLQPL